MVTRIVFHATRADFGVFNMQVSDLGPHFGSLEQIEGAARLAQDGSWDGVMVMPVWLRLCNPLRLKDVGSFHSDGVALQLERKGMLPRGEGRRIHALCDKDFRQRKVFDPVVREAIQAAGHDGIAYRNEFERDGGDSYIVFRPEQVKSAIGNAGTFDLGDPDITDARYRLALETEQRMRAAGAQALLAVGCGVAPVRARRRP